jgi:hypothetical protein
MKKDRSRPVAVFDIAGPGLHDDRRGIEAINLVKETPHLIFSSRVRLQ